MRGRFALFASYLARQRAEGRTADQIAFAPSYLIDFSRPKSLHRRDNQEFSLACFLDQLELAVDRPVMDASGRRNLASDHAEFAQNGRAIVGS